MPEQEHSKAWTAILQLCSALVRLLGSVFHKDMAPWEQAHGLNDQKSRKYDVDLGKVWRNWSHPIFRGTGVSISTAEDQRDGTEHQRQPENSSSAEHLL